MKPLHIIPIRYSTIKLRCFQISLLELNLQKWSELHDCVHNIRRLSNACVPVYHERQQWLILGWILAAPPPLQPPRIT